MIEYRDAGAQDSALIAGLFERAFVETFGPLYRPEDLRAFLDRLSPEGFRSDIQDEPYRFRLAFDGGTAAGFCKLGPLTLPVSPERPAQELRQLYLLKAYQGSGIATMLMDCALEEARRQGTEELYLTVYKDNPRAKAFYRRYGFDYVKPYAFMVGSQADEDEIWRASLA